MGVGCEEGHPSQRPGTQVRIAEMVHTCRIAPTSSQTVFDGAEGRRWPARHPGRLKGECYRPKSNLSLELVVLGQLLPANAAKRKVSILT
jgi:hypothetical protein